MEIERIEMEIPGRSDVPRITGHTRLHLQQNDGRNASASANACGRQRQTDETGETGRLHHSPKTDRPNHLSSLRRPVRPFERNRRDCEKWMTCASRRK